MPFGEKWVKRAQAEATSLVKDEHDKSMKAEMIKNV